MFKPNTVFVVGAGASSEFGMPLGWELSQRIRDNLALTEARGYSWHYKDRLFEQLIRARFKDDRDAENEVHAACALVEKGITHAQSIDSFIDMHSEKPMIALVGKLQIALEILRAEAGSELQVDRSNIYNRIDIDKKRVRESWLRVFTEILLEKARATDLGGIGRNLSVVCFNYDRCIEHYLIESIETTLGTSYEEAHDIVYGLNIIHPYGTIGRLPRSRGGSGGPGEVPFGADVEHVNIWAVSEGLSTFTEEIGDEAQLKRIHDTTGHADRLVCLGFGFQAQNVSLLRPPKGGADRTRAATGISTGIGIHEVARREIRGALVQMLGPCGYNTDWEAIMINVGCGELMRHNRLVLSGA